MSDVEASFVSDIEAHARVVDRIRCIVNLEARFPELPFISRSGSVSVGEYVTLNGEDIVPLLRSLVTRFADESLLGLSVEPDANYFAGHYGFLPAFELPAAFSVDDFWRCLTYSPTGDPTGEISEATNVLAIVGSSSKWALWGERNWELFVSWSAEVDPQAESGDNTDLFLPPREALEAFAGYKSWGTQLDHFQTEALIQALSAFGTSRYKP